MNNTYRAKNQASRCVPAFFQFQMLLFNSIHVLLYYIQHRANMYIFGLTSVLYITSIASLVYCTDLSLSLIHLHIVSEMCTCTHAYIHKLVQIRCAHTYAHTETVEQIQVRT